MLGQDFVARDFHTNVIKSSATLKLNTSHGANAVMIFYVELDADNGATWQPNTPPQPTFRPTTPKSTRLEKEKRRAKATPRSVCGLGVFVFVFVFVCLVIEINPSIEVEFNLAQNG